MVRPLPQSRQSGWSRTLQRASQHRRRSKLRVLTNLDRGALAAYCSAYALWAEAIEAIQKFGVMVKSPTGFPIQSPYVSIANRQAEIMLRIASEFGFTPASRGRISTPSEWEPDLFDQIKGRG